MRTTREIDDPTWQDIEDRDALIRKLSNLVRGELEREHFGGHHTIMTIDVACENALIAIGDLTRNPHRSR